MRKPWFGLMCTLGLAFPGGWVSAASPAVQEAVRQQVHTAYPSLRALYLHLHEHPEVSWQEVETSRRIADEWRQAGLEVTTGIGTNGIVGRLRNGAGPTVLIRTDLDGLPVREETGAAYAATRRGPDGAGGETAVMHACGHDVHMTVVTGTARVLAALTNQWHGTLLFIGQPCEERGSGARAMLQAGLYQRFARPDFALSLHCSPQLAAGSVAFTEGYSLANVDTVDIRIRGVGGHGAYPHLTRDPVVLAAQSILALQTIRSREIAPRDAVVVTVGSVHGGTKHNIIPDDVALQLTVRSFTDEVRNHALEAIRRIVRGQAIAAGIPDDRLPEVVLRDGFTPALYNDPPLTRRLSAALKTWLTEARVEVAEPAMGGEDFSEFGRTPEKVPLCDFWLGTVDPARLEQSRKTGQPLPSLHSSAYLPVIDPTLETGVTAMVGAVLELTARP